MYAYNIDFAALFGEEIDLNEFNYYEGYIQSRITDRLDLKLMIGGDHFSSIFYRLSTPIALTHSSNSRNYSQGFMIEPILSYRSILYNGFGGGLGLSYQQNWRSLSFGAGVRSIYESTFSERTSLYVPTAAWTAEFYLNVGIWLSRGDDDSAFSPLRSSYWGTVSVGYDEEFYKYTAGIMTSFEDREWFALGLEYMRTKRTTIWNGDGSDPSQQTLLISPINVYLGRADFRPVQLFYPNSAWDPFISAQFGAVQDLRSNDWLGTLGLTTGLRYWWNDRIGTTLEYGVWMKLGLHLGVSYRLQ